MSSPVVAAVNAVLDRVPRQTVHVGARVLPAFRSIGIVGYHVALLVAMVTGLRAGVPLLDVLGLSAAAALSFFAWAVLRRAVTGHETLVLLEHTWAALGAVALYFAAIGGPVAPGLDVLAVGLCPFLAAGRIGCLTAGCCHGQPSGVGVVYRAAQVWAARLRGVRLFPVQLVEAVALLTIGAVGYGLAGGTPGTATVWVLAAYATVRFGVEALRGDRRPVVAGVPVARAMAAAQLALALALSEAWLVAGGVERRQLVAVAVLSAALAGGLAVDRRRRDPLAAPAHLDELWTALVTLAYRAPGDGAPPATATTSRGVCLAGSWSDHGMHASLSHPSAAVDGLAYALGLVPLATTATATHVLVPPDRLGVAPPARTAPPATAAPVGPAVPSAPAPVRPVADASATGTTAVAATGGNGYFGVRVSDQG
jgi:hypothetical protein